MAKVKGPLLSMRASGTIGKNIVFAQWRGIPYTRQHVVPSNPRTAGQTLTRGVFKLLNDIFRRLGPLGMAPWGIAAEGRPFTDRNAFIKTNLPLIRDMNDLTMFQGSPGVNGGPAMQGFAAVPGVAAASIDIDWTEGPLPAGWTIQSAVAFAIETMDPSLGGTPVIIEGEHLGPTPYALALGALVASAAYTVVGWLVYLRPDGSTAYSPSVTIESAASA